jgi:hypothetical protein
MLSLERSARLSSTCKPHSSGVIERTHIRTLRHHGECHVHRAHFLVNRDLDGTVVIFLEIDCYCAIRSEYADPPL